MPIYPHKCKCGVEVEISKPIKACNSPEYCECGQKLQRVFTMPMITGTRDGFGIGKGWTEKDGKVIDTWKSWSKAGYSNPLDSGKKNMKANVKDAIKRKHEKITKYDNRKKFSVVMGGK